MRVPGGRAFSTGYWLLLSSDRDLFRKVNVLNRVQKPAPFPARGREGFAPGDEAHAAAALVDDGGAHGLGHVALTFRFAAGVDEAAAPHVAVQNLIADEVNRVVARQVCVNLRVGLAVRAFDVERVVAAVSFGQLLLDDVRLDGDAKVVGLPREVCGGVHVALFGLELRVAQVAPENRRHAELVREREGVGDLDELAARLFGAEVDGRAHGGSAEVVCLLDRAEQDLVELVRVGQKLVVVDLDDEGNLVRVLARDRAEHAEGRSAGVAAALNRQPHDVLRVEVERVGRERRARRVLYALVDGEYGEVARAREPPVVEERLQRAKNLRAAVGVRPDAVYEVRAGRVQKLFRNLRRVEFEQRTPVLAEKLFDARQSRPFAPEFGSHLLKSSKKESCERPAGITNRARIISRHQPASSLGTGRPCAPQPTRPRPYGRASPAAQAVRAPSAAG